MCELKNFTTRSLIKMVHPTKISKANNDNEEENNGDGITTKTQTTQGHSYSTTPTNKIKIKTQNRGYKSYKNNLKSRTKN